MTHTGLLCMNKLQICTHYYSNFLLHALVLQTEESGNVLLEIF
jgi:hypothetical protein